MMHWQFTPFAIYYILSACVSFIISFIGWKMRPVRGALQFSILSFFGGLWPLAYILGFFNTNLAWKLVMVRFEYAGIIGFNFFWLLFIIVYAYYDHWLSKRVILLIGTVPAITFIQVLTFTHHPFFYRAYHLVTENGLVLFKKTYGPGFYLWTGFAYMVTFVGAIILVWGVMNIPRHLRRQILPILGVVLLATLSNLLYITGYNPIAPYDPTPICFVFFGCIFFFIMRRYKFLDIVPVAHDSVFRNINTGVIVIDARTRIIDLNPLAEKILGKPADKLLTQPLSSVFSIQSELVQSLSGTQEGETHIMLDGEPHIFEFQTTQLASRSGKQAGHIIMLFDISRRKQMEQDQVRLIQELKKRNQQLNEAMEEIKNLKGIIPICASCKKIRDDKGYWNLLESYIESHSEASFSHSICPECNDKLYGEQDWYIKMKQRKNKEQH